MADIQPVITEYVVNHAPPGVRSPGHWYVYVKRVTLTDDRWYVTLLPGEKIGEYLERQADGTYAWVWIARSQAPTYPLAFALSLATTHPPLPPDPRPPSPGHPLTPSPLAPGQGGSVPTSL